MQISLEQPRLWPAGWQRVWPGLLLSVVIAVASAFIAQSRGGPTLLYALLLGMALNPVAMEGKAKAGVDVAARNVLRIGVALLGARITFEQVGTLGWRGVVLVASAVAITIASGSLLSRALGLSRRLGVLTGGATAICGASAAIAIATVLPRDDKSDRELVFTVAGVTVLSTLAMVLYPLIAHAIGLDMRQTGLFLGGTIHDVAQVVGAGYSISPEAGDFAVLAKLFRVAMLLPVVVAISLVVRHRFQRVDTRGRDPLLPRFLLAFGALVVIGSMGLIPAGVSTALGELARACLVVAIAAVGLKTSPLEMKRVGARAFALLAIEAAVLAAFVIGAQKLI
ncbi:MAG TPA: putative sulfate exporter family transporter [Casimicrobiaceae bacterium]